MDKLLHTSLLTIVACIVFSGCDLQNQNMGGENDLRTMAESAGAAAIHNTVTTNKDKVELGRKLFFDKLLSGNKDISCATCHHPTLNTGDALSLSIGVGGNGLGESRQMGEGRERIPRNAPEIYNRGASEWHTMFWDNRVTGTPKKGFISPAGNELPKGLENILAVQAMFPVTSRGEMRGNKGDTDVNGERNMVAEIPNDDLPAIWDAIMQRLLGIPEYVELFKKAYPEVSIENCGFEHAANAIAAFEAEAFTFTNSPWDRYLRGDETALSEIAKRGAQLFYGEAQCSNCHSGKLMTDQLVHNICILQLGPGKGDAAPLDLGSFGINGVDEERFAFRTPPLRNVEHTGPWMHNGAYTSLEQAVRHHLNPANAIKNYELTQLEESLQPTVITDKATQREILSTLDPMSVEPVDLSDREVDELVTFLKSLTDPEAVNLGHLVPETVPSGLPVED